MKRKLFILASTLLAIGVSFSFVTCKKPVGPPVGPTKITSAKISFGENVTCYNNTTVETCNSGDIVNVGDVLLFTFSDNRTPPFVANNWIINDKKVSDRVEFKYIVKAEDVKSGAITISCTTREAEEIKINFDSSIVVTTPRGTQTGRIFREGEFLVFYPRVGGRGKFVSKWMINGIETDAIDFHVAATKTCEYTFDAKDATDNAGTKEITIAFETLEAKNFTVEFDDTKLDVHYITTPRGQYTLTKGAIIYEQESIVVQLKDASAVANTWKINGKAFTGSKTAWSDIKDKEFSFIVEENLADATGKISIDFE